MEVKSNKYNIREILKSNLVIFIKPEDEIVKERRKVVEKTFEELGIKLNYFEGPYPEEWLKDDLVLYKKKDLIHKNYGVAGLCYSFIKSIKYAKENNLKSLFFFEDDALPINNKTFFDDFKKSLKKMDKKDRIWYNKPYILDFGHNIYCEKRHIKHKNNVWVNRNRFWAGTHSLLITKPAIDILYNNIFVKKSFPKYMPLDYALTQIKHIKKLAYTGIVSDEKMFRGIFKQYATFCKERKSIINRMSSKNGRIIPKNNKPNEKCEEKKNLEFISLFFFIIIITLFTLFILRKFFNISIF